MHKSVSEYRDGYKAHVAVELETGLVTPCDLTPANVGDGPAGVAPLTGEQPGLQVLADSAYGSGEIRAALRTAKHAVPGMGFRAANRAVPPVQRGTPRTSASQAENADSIPVTRSTLHCHLTHRQART